ncbi:MAG: cytochrome c oxidase assembly protein [Cycloclasticus sp. symbiont of Bathymodiolus heckerae]|nr:MAG: cytochrome c oxidase assembly protein [Cycloclasticus sp. symbiont of Bathymodiolus heckerae]
MKAVNIIFVLVLLVALSACSKDEPTRLTNVKGLIPDLSFELTDEDNKTVTAEDYLGYTVAIFFGFTSCPDICPTTMHQLSGIMKEIDSAGSKIRVLFISVDPDRDSAEKLKKYTDVFGSAFIGLRGEDRIIKEMTKRYRVTFGYGESDAEGNYEVSHSGAVFIFDNEGKARLLATQSSRTEDLTYDLKNLLNHKIKVIT